MKKQIISAQSTSFDAQSSKSGEESPENLESLSKDQ